VSSSFAQQSLPTPQYSGEAQGPPFDDERNETKKKNKTKYVREKEMYRCNKPITDTDTHKKTDCQSTGETRSSY
jgi:hypothetical protein